MQCGEWGEFDDAVRCAIGFAWYAKACRFQPVRGFVALQLFAALGTINAGRVFDWSKLFDALGFIDEGTLAEREGIEDETFEFDTVGGSGIDNRPGRHFDVRDFLLSAMERKCEGGVGCEAFEEFDADDVNRD